MRRCFPVLRLLLLGLLAPLAQAQPDYVVDTVARGLEKPFAMTLLPDGEILITEKPGRVRVVREGRLLAAPIPGARLAFMRDESLLITVGDGYEYREQAQSLSSLLGKVIRVTDAGRIPDDNPFVGSDGKRSPIWSYGHRHPQGLLYDAATDAVYEHEHGPQGGDELNVILKGANYGWPLATYGISYSGIYVSPYQSYPGTKQPLVYWTPSLAPCGMAQCRGCQWPQWEGDLFIGMLAGKQVRRVSMRAGAAPTQEALLTEMRARTRDVRFGPDGALYVLQDEGTLLKLSAKKRREVDAR